MTRIFGTALQLAGLWVAALTTAVHFGATAGFYAIAAQLFLIGVLTDRPIK